MNTLLRKNPTYKLDNLPKLSSFSFNCGDEIGYTGTIVKRKLKKAGPALHYGFLYGADASGNILVIENNDEGVECVTWEDFLSEAIDFEFGYIEKNPKRHTEIMIRAHERANEKYILNLNNCEHFVNYCVHNKLESFQANLLNDFADKFIALAEIYYLKQSEPVYKDLLKEYNELRESFGIKRSNLSLDNLVKKKIT